MWTPQKSGRINLRIWNERFAPPLPHLAWLCLMCCCTLGPFWVSSHSCGRHGHNWCVEPQQTVSFQVCFTSDLILIQRVWNLISVYLIYIIMFGCVLQIQRCWETKGRSGCRLCEQSCSWMCSCPVSFPQQLWQLEMGFVHVLYNISDLFKFP